MQTYDFVFPDKRREFQSHAEWTELNRHNSDALTTLDDRYWKFPARQKTCLLSIEGQKVSSARICNTDLPSRSRMVAARLRSGRIAKILSISVRFRVPVAPAVVTVVVVVGGENCWVLIAPSVFPAPLKRLNPSCCSLVRSTSANLTSSSTCCSWTGATVSEFTTGE